MTAVEQIDVRRCAGNRWPDATACSEPGDGS